jgi:hypothetical protein
MIPHYIISLASEGVRLQYLAMERSLRAVGCDLDIKVIPFNSQLFKLPKGSTWWADLEMQDWIKSSGSKPVMVKYQCLKASHYAYFDADICFLRNPLDIISGISGGMIVADTDWNKPQWTYTPESQEILQRKSSTWLKNVFNTGHFACDQALYTHDELVSICIKYHQTCLDYPYHEQPGINLLVGLKDIPVINLTLPPYNMESTWVGDYYYPDYQKLWTAETKPYFLHWAGPCYSWDRPPNEIFFEYLTRAERQEWEEREIANAARIEETYLKSLPWWRAISRRVRKNINLNSHRKP